MPESKSKPKPSAPAKPGLEIKPVQDLEPDESQSEDVRGGIGGAAGPGRGGAFSDARLKSQVAPFRDALVGLRALRF